MTRAVDAAEVLTRDEQRNGWTDNAGRFITDEEITRRLEPPSARQEAP